MRRRARTDLCGGRSVMVVPTATATTSGSIPQSAVVDSVWRCQRQVTHVLEAEFHHGYTILIHLLRCISARTFVNEWSAVGCLNYPLTNYSEHPPVSHH